MFFVMIYGEVAWENGKVGCYCVMERFGEKFGEERGTTFLEINSNKRYGFDLDWD
jgi:hypothetical protein